MNRFITLINYVLLSIIMFCEKYGREWRYFIWGYLHLFYYVPIVYIKPLVECDILNDGFNMLYKIIILIGFIIAFLFILFLFLHGSILHS